MYLLLEKYIIGRNRSGKLALSRFMLGYSILLALISGALPKRVIVFAVFINYLADVAMYRDSIRPRKFFFCRGTVLHTISLIVYAASYVIVLHYRGLLWMEKVSQTTIWSILYILLMFLVMAAFEERVKDFDYFCYGIVSIAIHVAFFGFMIYYGKVLSDFKGTLAAVAGGLNILANAIFLSDRIMDFKFKPLKTIMYWIYPISQFLLITLV